MLHCAVKWRPNVSVNNPTLCQRYGKTSIYFNSLLFLQSRSLFLVPNSWQLRWLSLLSEIGDH